MTKEEIISGLRMTMELIQFDPATGNVRPIYTLNDLDKTTYVACKKAIEALKAQDVPDTNVGSNDLISRQEAIELIECMKPYQQDADDICEMLQNMPSAQPEIVRCKDCIYYDPPHIENNGVRYEYDEMPADAFDALGTGLVNAEYGINIGGRCCVDYYCKNYSDDKRVFVREDNYCGRAERRTDEQTD